VSTIAEVEAQSKAAAEEYKDGLPKKVPDTHPGDGRSWYVEFIDELRKQRSVMHACRKIGVGRTQAYELKKQDAQFRAAWDDAVASNKEDLVASAMKRAIDGYLEPIVYKGQVVHARVRFDPVLTIFMLKKNVPGYEDHAANAGGAAPEELAEYMRRAAEAMFASVPTTRERQLAAVADEDEGGEVTAGGNGLPSNGSADPQSNGDPGRNGSD
jgi:hypothetical protein